MLKGLGKNTSHWLRKYWDDQRTAKNLPTVPCRLSLIMELNEQRPVVHQVAAQYWDRPSSEVGDALQDITVIKRTGGKIMGFIPAFEGHPEVFYKVYFYDRGFNFESTGLKAANAMPHIDGVTVPEVVAIYPKHKAILTEKEDWGGERTGLQRFYVGSLGIDWFKVGRWLRTFHDSQVSQEKNDYFLRKKFEKIESHISDLQGLFSAEQVGKMRKIIEDARKYFETAQIEWVISHGDFGLSNIQKKGEDLEIIDFEDCQSAPRAFDVLNCLTRMEYAKYFFNRPYTFTDIKHNFLSGYGIYSEYSKIDNFFYLLIKMDIIETYHRRRKNSRKFSKLIFFIFEKVNKKYLSLWVKKTTN